MVLNTSFTQDQINTLHEAFQLHMKKHADLSSSLPKPTSTLDKPESSPLDERLPLKDFLRMIREYLGIRIITKDFVLQFFKEQYSNELMRQIETDPRVQDDIMNLELTFDNMLEILDAKHLKTITTKQKIIEVFREFDVDSSGQITTIEVAHIFKRFLGENLTQSEIKSLVEMIDHSQDGRISLEEWVSFMMKLLKKSDYF
mmetsp:Transcript_4756/g.17836  ORF Transcript_4756/g.17836 Transcript_4756/m.17836 type:complete len:201 (+) Transcript_4756:194-796(+)